MSGSLAEDSQDEKKSLGRRDMNGIRRKAPKAKIDWRLDLPIQPIGYRPFDLFVQTNYPVWAQTDRWGWYIYQLSRSTLVIYEGEIGGVEVYSPAPFFMRSEVQSPGRWEQLE